MVVFNSLTCLKIVGTRIIPYTKNESLRNLSKTFFRLSSTSLHQHQLSVLNVIVRHKSDVALGNQSEERISRLIPGSNEFVKETSTKWRGRYTFLFHVTIICGGAALSALLGFKTLKEAVSVQAAKPFFDDDIAGSGRPRSPSSSDANDNSVKGKFNKRRDFNFVADVVEAVGDTVVCIESKDNTLVDWVTRKPEVLNTGSGFIVSEDGLILTNAHVVLGRGGMSLTVKLHDGRIFPARIEDMDLKSDLAILRIKTRGLPTMPIGSSSETRTGEWVVAMGSPHSLTNTVTVGVVSSLNRTANELGLKSNDISYIQTDAAVTFGNSGGPLVNLDGEAIGINSMAMAPGISFAIPIDYVKGYLAEAEQRRVSGVARRRRRYIGATLYALTEDLVRELHASNSVVPQISRGVIVWRVVIGSPAYTCGLKPGDIIYKVNEVDVTSTTPIFEALEKAESLKFHVLRQNATTPNFTCILYPEEVPEYSP